jgi:hypothetical protein
MNFADIPIGDYFAVSCADGMVILFQKKTNVTAVRFSYKLEAYAAKTRFIPTEQVFLLV